MSRRRRNSVEDRRKLQKIDHLFFTALEQAHALRISEQQTFENDSDSDQSMDCYLQVEENIYLPTLIAIAEIAKMQHSRVYAILEDTTIEFGQTKTIDDFSDSDSQMYFRFLKADLKIVAQQLWPRLSPFLNSDNPERIPVGNRTLLITRRVCAYIYTKCRIPLDYDATANISLV